MLIDSHCHLDHFEESERQALIENALSSGVVIMQTISTLLSDFDKIINIARSRDFIYASVGTHPESAAKEPLRADDIIKICNEHPKKVIGIGETGLDYHYSHETKLEQKTCFIEHIIASQHTGLPLIVHTRDADQDTLNILTFHKKKKDFPVLMHCFTGGKDFAAQLLEIGCFISFSGIVTFKKAEDVLESCLLTPISRLLIETDSPFLAPVPMRGKRNEPAFLKYTAKFIAEKRGITYEELATHTGNNFRKLFNI